MTDDLSTYETLRENAERAGDLERVARLCMEAPGPSRDLDGTIWAVMQGVTLLIWERPASTGEVLSYRGSLAYPDVPGVANYSSSLDAAASLIPEGYDWILERVNDGMTIGARVGHNDPDRTSWGETPALALCAAALRSRMPAA